MSADNTEPKAGDVEKGELYHEDNLDTYGQKVAAEDRVVLTEEDDAKIRRKTDKRILTLLVWLYFLQILDKSVLGYGAVFGLKTDAKLVGNQYSVISSMNAIAQLAWMPFSSYLIVRVPARYLMTFMVFGWGAAQACMAASTNYHALIATRFFLGLFEAACLPMFAILTAQWYRRAEQPVRVAAWYSTNGLATIFAALVSFGLGHIKSDKIHAWQIIFMFVGLITVLSAPLVYFFLDGDVASARFLNEKEKAQAIERLRANQTGTGTTEFKWAQVWEMLYDPKSWLWLFMALLLNIGASVTNAFGPTLIKGFGFDIYITALLNTPFGALQFICILFASYAVHKWKLKSAVLAGFVVPVIIGLALLFAQGVAGKTERGPALAGYYLLAFLFGGNPLIVSWMISNTAGQTKKSAIMSLYNMGSAVGNIVGPLLFNSKDGPHYVPGLKAVMAMFCALLAVIGAQVVVLVFFNKQRENQRVAHNKPAKLVDTSMSNKYVAYQTGEGLGQNALLDLTDFKNDEFVYVY